MEPILVIMAAGMGSRYGGNKQLDSISIPGLGGSGGLPGLDLNAPPTLNLQ